MTDRYQFLREVLVTGSVLVALKRPEGYEDVHPEILIDDAAAHPAFKPEHVGAELAALLRDNDKLREALRSLCAAYVRLMESGRDRILDLGGECDPLDAMEARDPDLRAARAALADGEAGNG